MEIFRICRWLKTGSRRCAETANTRDVAHLSNDTAPSSHANAPPENASTGLTHAVPRSCRATIKLGERPTIELGSPTLVLHQGQRSAKQRANPWPVTRKPGSSLEPSAAQESFQVVVVRVVDGNVDLVIDGIVTHGVHQEEMTVGAEGGTIVR